MKKSSSALLVAVFVPLYGWDVWEALGNLLGLPGFYEALGVGGSTPWVLLWAGVAAPFVVFGGALWFFRRRKSAAERIAIFLLGWALVAILGLTLAGIEQAWRASVLGFT